MNETLDEFLGGKVKARQPKHGFRAGTDTILLAAAVDATTGQRVLELGSGSGVCLLCLGARVVGLRLFGVELVEENRHRAERNLQDAGLLGEVIAADIFASNEPILKEQYDHVFMNPPFYAERSNTKPSRPEKSSAHMLQHGVGEWVQAALKRVRPQGLMTMIFPTEGLQDILAAIPKGNAICILPVTSSPSRPPKRLLIRVQTQRNAPLKIYPALALKDENGDRSSFEEAIARNNAAIEW